MAFDGEAFVARFNTVWNGHDLDGILAMMTDDVVFEASFGKDPWGAGVVGQAAVREFLEDMFRRIPDVRWDEIRIFACTELAVVEWLTTGTPRGGTRYEVQGCDVLALRHGKIAAKPPTERPSSNRLAFFSSLHRAGRDDRRVEGCLAVEVPQHVVLVDVVLLVVAVGGRDPQARNAEDGAADGHRQRAPQDRQCHRLLAPALLQAHA